jgi:hypothetical protein
VITQLELVVEHDGYDLGRRNASAEPPTAFTEPDRRYGTTPDSALTD